MGAQWWEHSGGSTVVGAQRSVVEAGSAGRCAGR